MDWLVNLASSKSSVRFAPLIISEYRMARTADDLPPEYFRQIKMNLLCTGRKWCDFVSFDPQYTASVPVNFGCSSLVGSWQAEQELLKTRHR